MRDQTSAIMALLINVITQIHGLCFEAFREGSRVLVARVVMTKI
jgi:hypothetical protein